MKKTKLLMIAVVLLLHSGLLHAQWKKLTSGTGSDLLGLHFPTATTGYVVGKEGTVLKTTDAGTTWAPAISGYAGDWFWDVQFKGTDTGFVCGETNPGTNPSGMGVILKTVDGGKTWTSVFFNSICPVRDLFMVSADTIYACGGAEMTYGYIWRTTDGGANWVPYGSAYYDGMLGGMYFKDGKRGFWGMYESVNGPVNPLSCSWMSTTDGLATAVTSNVPSSSSFWEFASSFPTSLNGYMMRGTYVSSFAVFVRITNDGGATWTEKSTGFTGEVYGMDFYHKDTGFIVGGKGNIWRTTDAAATWTAQTSPVTTDLRSAFCYKNQAAYAVGFQGTIIKLDLGGKQGQTMIEEASADAQVQFGPNPARDALFIDGLKEAASFQIVDSRGALVQQGDLASGANTVSVNGLSSGVYFLTWKGQSVSGKHKFEVQR